jgi:ABC-type bacteriocin/lantibiotic exporter with double-glycine peptidase domain
MNVSRLNKSFILQHGESDCGPACLASIIQYHGGKNSLDEIRRITGTTQTGTNLLGLYQGARQLGFDAAGLECEGIENLRELRQPAILHVTLENHSQHYLVFYGFEEGQLLIGDPARGVSKWSLGQLQEVWKSKSLLKLSPNQRFKKEPSRKKKYPQLITWIKEDINILIACVFIGLLMAIFSLALAIFSQKLIDVILPTKEMTKLVVGLSLFGFILLARLGLGLIRSTFLITHSRDFNIRMVDSFFKSLLDLPKPFFDSKKIGEMIARMNDTRRIQSAVNNLVGNILLEAFMVIVSLIGVFVYSWLLGLLVISLLPLYFLILWKLNQPIIFNQKDVMNRYAMNESNYIDVISGISEIKITGTTPLFHKYTNLFFQVFQDSIFRLGKLQIKFNFGIEFVGFLLTLIIVSFSAYLVITDQLMLGGMVAVLSLSGASGSSLTRLAFFNFQLQEAYVALNRMEEFTTLKKENTSGNSISEIKSLSIENLHFNFPGSLSLLKNVNIKIEQNKVTTLLGESGAGKSTLMQILQRFYDPVSGQISTNGIDIKTLQLESYRRQLGVVPQEIKIFNNSLFFNITLSEDPRELESLRNWCQENGLDHFFSNFPQNYLTLLGEEGVNISGGQKQLVGFARALYRKPTVLLIDEGTSAMDKITERFILNMIKNHKRGMAIFIVTHRLSVAQKSDYIYLMANGNITQEGAPSTFTAFFELD